MSQRSPREGAACWRVSTFRLGVGHRRDERRPTSPRGLAGPRWRPARLEWVRSWLRGGWAVHRCSGSRGGISSIAAADRGDLSRGGHGHAARNLLLQAVAMDLGAVPIGAFYDEQVGDALGLPADHRPLYLIPVGHPRR
ncbi:MAG TPA: nitroreductase family protein [Anaerolineae bacterium]|nr:nitroreductase family protein [Anaerolineae bacterium]